MAGFKLSLPMGTLLTPHIDAGTLVRGLSLPPVPLELPHVLGEAVRRRLRRGARVGLEVGWDIARRAAMAELQMLRDDVDRALQYIAGLPGWLRKEAAYEFFAAFFSDPLPKMMLHCYVFGGGAALKLSEQEMINCNPLINLAQKKKFLEVLAVAGKTPGKPVPLNIKILGFALTNGTLGSFTVSIKGTLVAGAGGAWQASGTMSFYDKFDFDPRAFAAGGRSFQGEIKTMVGHYMIPGDDYEVTSVDTTFRQSEADDTIVWAGGTPKPVLDRVATADMKMIDE